MIRADVLYLINESPDAHGVFDSQWHGNFIPDESDSLTVVPDSLYQCEIAPVEETKSMRFCTVRSVGFNEFYAAKSAGIEPSIVFRMEDYSDYDGQKIVEWNGTRYRVIRTYTNSQMIELTCELATNDREAV